MIGYQVHFWNVTSSHFAFELNTRKIEWSFSIFAHVESRKSFRMSILAYKVAYISDYS